MAPLLGKVHGRRANARWQKDATHVERIQELQIPHGEHRLRERPVAQLKVEADVPINELHKLRPPGVLPQATGCVGGS